MSSTTLGGVSRLSHVQSLDGLRAISVLMVAASHCGFGNIIPGGLGVTIFFFLSGFLITTLLQREYAATGTVALKTFFIRRVVRLAPVFVLTLFIADGLAYTGILRGNLTATGLLAQLFYFANYYAVFFAGAAKTADGTGVFWSLAVEEHFYLVYPFLLSAILLRLTPSRRALALFVACIAILGWRVFISLSGTDVSDRIFFCTDTRADSILYGCIFAVLVPAVDLSANITTPKTARALIFLGSALILVSLAVRGPFFRDTLRYSLQGLALFPIFYGILTRNTGSLAKVLNSRVLSYLGKISYAFYLVHFIIYRVLSIVPILARYRILMLLSVVVISTLYAHVTTKRVEAPFRRWMQRRDTSRATSKSHSVTNSGISNQTA